MAARKKKDEPQHVNAVMRRIRSLANGFPIATAQARLDEIAELATKANVDVSPVKIRSNREEPASEKSGRSRGGE